MSKWMNIALWSFATLALIVLVGFSDVQQNKVLLKDVEPIIFTEDGNFFVNKQEVEALVYGFGYGNEQTALSKIDIYNLETELEKNPSIKNADVYASINGVLHVKVQQRKPIVRIANTSGKQFYIDSDGQIMPLLNSFSARVLVANGALNASQSSEGVLSEELAGIFELSTAIVDHPFWNAQFTQIYRLPNGDLELIPKVGKHTILFGKPIDIDSKLKKLMVFYKEGLDKTGWNNYGTINLKFKDQVVCTKR